MTLLAVLKGLWSFLLRYWKEIGMLILILLLCAQVEKCTAAKYELKIASLQAAADKERAESLQRAMEQERGWVVAFDLSLGLHQENMNETLSQRDRIIAGLRSGRLSFRAGCPTVPEVAADPAPAEAGAEGGQPGLVGEAITARLAQCDEVTHERNLAVELLKAERVARP